MARFILTLVFSAFAFGFAWAQQVTGTVTSWEGDPLPGVTVQVKGSSTGTVTDLEGQFTINVSGPEDILVLSFVGFVTEEIQVGSQTVIDVVMVEDIARLQQVVVVGYGEQKREDLTSSVAVLDGSEIADVPGTYSFDGAMQGQVAGVNITNSSATPGAGINVSIRGFTSVEASSQPLFVIDGIPVVTGNNSALNGNIQPVNPLADINPNDIESISVLKDASAAAIYGSRGANGVIIITTKRGAAGKTEISANYTLGVSTINNIPEMMSSSEWIEFMNVAAANDGLGENYWNGILGDPDDPNLRNTDVYDELFRTGISHDANLSFKGGNDKTQFFLSGNYFDQEGIQVGQGFRRYSTRLNIDHSVNDKLGIGSSVLLSRTEHDRTINENDLYGVVINAQAWDPTAPLRDDQGNYTDPTQFNAFWPFENPLVIANEYINFSQSSRVLASVFGEYDITRHFNFRSTWSIDYNTLNEESFTPAGFIETPDGLAEFATYEELSWLTENTLGYNNQWGAHNLGVIVGYTAQESNQQFSNLNVQGFSSNLLPSPALASTVNSATASGTDFGFVSYLSRINYDYDSRYLLGFSFRADGSSRFGPDQRFGYFPAVSAAWRISNEDFLADWKRLDDLKLRASYGTTGNASIGNFSWQGAWSLDRPYNLLPGSAQSVLDNPQLSWETTTQLNLGLDLTLFDSRVSLTADYFQKTTTELLQNVPVPGVSGITSITSNSGEIQNSGLEFSLNTLNLTVGDFKWTTSANITFLRNEVIDVEVDSTLLGRNFILLEGRSLSTFNLIKFLGVDPTSGDALFEDINGDGQITLDDRQPIGSGIPDMFGGITNTFTYGPFSLSAFLQFVRGNEIYNQSRFAYENYGALSGGGLPYGNQARRSLDYWQTPGQVTDIPRPSLVAEGPNAQFQRFSTQYLEDGSFMRLKNVTLSYVLPQELLNRLRVTSGRVFVQGQNLLTFTNYLGFDPEINSNTSNREDLNTRQGEDFGTLGQARTFTCGVSLNF